MKITLLIAFVGSAAALFGQSIMPLNAPFMQGQSMKFDYTGGTGSPTDWVGIYQHNQVPGNIASTVWKYVSTPAGVVEFDGNLAAGFYDIHLFCCDGYDIIASFTNFQVTAERLRSRLNFYKSTDSIRFHATMVATGDLVAIYHASDFSNGAVLPGAVQLAAQTIANVNASQEATLNFAPQPATAEYAGVLFSGSQILGYDYFQVKPTPVLPDVITRIGTGSCGNQNSAQPTLEHILQHDIDLFLYTGDNLYIDTYSANTMRSAYENFISNRTEFQQLRATAPLLATWDDHDYGCCDEDADYPIKAQSQQIFLDFFEEPANSPRRTQEGIYTSYTIGEPGQKLQVILLDTRYFLDDKRPNNGCGINDYCPWAGPGDTFRTMLGDAQWAWLKTVLLEPADLRLVATSVQFSSSYHGFEQWGLFPYQRKKFQELVKETQAERLFFVSGDMHYSEVSKLDDDPNLYPLYDFTASAINQSWPPEANQNRVPGKVYGDPNVGLISIDWQNQTLTFTTLDAQNAVRFEYAVPFSELEFSANAAGEFAPKPLTFRQMPSPGKGSARLVFGEKLSGELALFDTTGQAVRRLAVENSEKVEVQDLPPGVYVAEFRAGRRFGSVKILVE